MQKTPQSLIGLKDKIQWELAHISTVCWDIFSEYARPA